MNNLSISRAYVLITPVKNEEKFIGETIESVITQSVLPLEWVIVSDGSTDQTNEIIARAADQQSWIKLISLPPREARSFASVVHAIDMGIKAITVDNYEYIGLLDADVRFERDYFKQVIDRFINSPKLGLAGGVVVDVPAKKVSIPRNRVDVPGAVQFFRREAFEQLGGLLPIPEGGWDAMTCVGIRMLGYETRLFTDLVVEHLKPRNIAEGGALARNWQYGVRDYVLGYHPMFEFLKCISRLWERPKIIGSAMWLAGYCAAILKRRPKFICGELLKHLHSEQLSRLKQQYLRK